MTASWDLFDTLIGRRCGTATRLFEQMGRLIEEPAFVERRLAAERSLQDRGIEYSLNAIYCAYAQLFGWPDPDYLAEVEWQLELQNVFPIKRNVDQMRPGDIVVSDMYLSEWQLRELMQKAGIPFQGKIYVSCYGKHTGQIWERVKAENTLSMHRGDHVVNDVTRPRALGILTSLVDTQLSPIERVYAGYSPDLAFWVRRHRLELIGNESKELLNTLQVELNAPFLWVASQMLAEYAGRQDLRRLLFMARDGCMWKQMFERLHPEFESVYLYISRECLRRGSEDYFTYLNHSLTEDAALVDVAASCGSLKAALPRLKVQSPRIWAAVFLPEPFKVQLGPIRCEYGTTNVRTKINNTLLEMLNYARHWHVADYIEGSGPVYDESGEYNMDLVDAYHRVFEATLDDMPAAPIENPGALLHYILQEINLHSKYLRTVFPTHLQFEKLRKKKFMEAR